MESTNLKRNKMKIVKILLKRIKSLIILELHRNKWRKLNSYNKNIYREYFSI